MLRMTSFIAAVVAFALTGSVGAAVVVPSVAEHGSHGGQGFGYPVGNLPNMTDLSAIDNSADVNDPNQWVANSNSWQTEWQSGSLLNSGTSVNGKIAWVAIDLGSVVANLDELFLWNQRENNGRFTDDYNVYISSAPSTALPPDSQQSGFANDVGWGAGDYDFASGGWAAIHSGNMSNRNADGNAVNDVINLGSASARYIAIEILSNTGDANRVGINEIAVTQIPEPASLALLALGGLCVAGRRRRG